MSAGEPAAPEAAPAPPGRLRRLGAYWTIELNLAILFLLVWLNFAEWGPGLGRASLWAAGAAALWWVAACVWRWRQPAPAAAELGACLRCGRRLAWVDNRAGRCPYCGAELGGGPPGGEKEWRAPGKTTGSG